MQDVDSYRKALRKKNSENARLRRRLQNSQKELAVEKQKNLRNEIASEKQLGADAAEFLTGETREEIEASAEKLRKLMGYEPLTAPKAGEYKGAKQDSSTEYDELDELAKRMYQR